MFTGQDIRERVLRQPFVPFRLITTSGQSYDVYHPDLVMVGKREVTLGIGSPDEPNLYERQSRVAVLHVTEIQDLPVSTSHDGKNGSMK